MRSQRKNISHVAMLVWIEGGLWVAEMKEFVGYRLRPASVWVKDQGDNQVYYGVCPEPIRGKHQIVDAALSYRASKYGYLSLIKVWWAQITRKKISVKYLVCSTFIERCWTMAGFTFDQTADPGDYMHLCETTTPIKTQ